MTDYSKKNEYLDLAIPLPKVSLPEIFLLEQEFRNLYRQKKEITNMTNINQEIFETHLCYDTKSLMYAKLIIDKLPSQMERANQNRHTSVEVWKFPGFYKIIPGLNREMYETEKEKAIVWNGLYKRYKKVGDKVIEQDVRFTPLEVQLDKLLQKDPNFRGCYVKSSKSKDYYFDPATQKYTDQKILMLRTFVNWGPPHQSV